MLVVPENALELINEILPIVRSAADRERVPHDPMTDDGTTIDERRAIMESCTESIVMLGFKWCGMSPLEYDMNAISNEQSHHLEFRKKAPSDVDTCRYEVPSQLADVVLDGLSGCRPEAIGTYFSAMYRELSSLEEKVEAHLKATDGDSPRISCRNDKKDLSFSRDDTMSSIKRQVHPIADSEPTSIRRDAEIEMGEGIVKENGLRRLIRDYLCVTDQSVMGDAVDQMLRAHSARIPVVFAGHPSHGMTEVISIASRIGLSFAVDEPGTDRKNKRTLTGSNLQIYIPRDSERLDDLERLLPFYFQKHIAEMANVQGVSVHSVEYLFLPLLVATLAEQPDAELDRIVRNALLTSKNGMIGIDSIAGSSNDIVFALQNSLAGLTNIALKYVGCELYDDVTDLPPSFPDHRLNEPVKQFNRDYAQREMYGIPDLDWFRHMPDTALVLRVLLIHPDDVGVIARNFVFFSKQDSCPKDKKVGQCLHMRLFGQSEKQISAELGYIEYDSYQAWLVENHIDILSREKLTAFERWKLAKGELFSGDLQPERKKTLPTAIEMQTARTKSSVESTATTQPDSIPHTVTTDAVADAAKHLGLSVLKIHTMSRQVLLDEEEVILKPTKINRFEALRFLLDNYLKTKQPVATYKIIKAAGGGKKVYDIFKHTPIKDLLVSNHRGYYSLRVDPEKSKVN